VKLAKKAFDDWQNTSIDNRSKILHKIADLIDKNLEKLAFAESRDTGKPIFFAKNVDMPRAASNFRFFASSIVNFASESHVMEDTAVNYTRRASLGVVGCISPWNLPLYLLTWKIAPALAMGNCVIAKPSELTPYTAWKLGEIVKEAGLPDGVLNILHGYGKEVGQAIVEHRDISAVSFTGGTETGKIIGKTAAEQFKKVSLELGGKNATIIFEDCDLQEAVENAVRSSFSNQGEICLCGSRILIQDTIYDQFKNQFIQKVEQLKKGNPNEEDTRFGALISEAHKNKVLSFIESARKDGGKILTGGKEFGVAGLAGYFIEPTVIEGLDSSCKINQEEVFGPVVTLLPFSTPDEAIKIANDTKYGLAFNIWTQNLTKAHNVAHKLEAGIIWVNCWMLRDLRTPFGGMKSSGVGREGGNEALRFFSEPQNICIRI
jgi:aminomuconate-semialdehyde/2-hydroxymuconate-6-semialdehyde dehydrogenase